MNKCDVGDIVWVPDGTIAYAFNTSGEPIKGSETIAGPVYGLVVDIIKNSIRTQWLKIKIGDRNAYVIEKRIRKIET